MIVRQALFRGRIHAGREAEFRRFVEERLMPLWRQFPGVRDVRVQLELDRDAGVDPVPLSLSMVFDDRAAVDVALAAPVRFESRGVTGELLTMFDGRVEHHVFEIL
jgi:hypothetical protein